MFYSFNPRKSRGGGAAAVTSPYSPLQPTLGSIFCPHLVFTPELEPKSPLFCLLCQVFRALFSLEQGSSNLAHRNHFPVELSSNPNQTLQCISSPGLDLRNPGLESLTPKDFVGCAGTLDGCSSEVPSVCIFSFSTSIPSSLGTVSSARMTNIAEGDQSMISSQSKVVVIS